jgi:hypothetical protein
MEDILDKPSRTLPTKTAIIAVADLHINSTVALCPKVVNLDDGGSYTASRTQRWLWECWLNFIAEAKILTEGYRNVVIIDGDLTELDTAKRSVQLTTLNKSTILGIVTDTIAPLVDISDVCYFIRGTSAHVGKSAWSEEAIAKDTYNTVAPGDGKFSWWHYRGVASGVKLDISHHAQMGATPWSRKNAANNMAAKIMWWYQIDMGEKAPDLVLRGHNHTYASSGDNYKCQVNYLPAWTTKTEFAYRVGYEDVVSDIGGIIYLCENGRFTRHKVMFQPKENKRIWKVSM